MAVTALRDARAKRHEKLVWIGLLLVVVLLALGLAGFVAVGFVHILASPGVG